MDDEVFNKITDGNNKFLLLCMKGKILNTNSTKIYNSNDKGMTCAHILALNNYDDELVKLVTKYPRFLKLRNLENMNPLQLVLSRYKLSIKLFKLMRKHGLIHTIDMKKFLNQLVEAENITILNELNKLNIDFDNIIEYAIQKKKIQLLFKIINLNVDVNKFYQQSPLVGAVMLKNTKLIEALLKKGVNVNNGNPINIAIQNNDFAICNLLMDDLDFTKTDEFLNLPIHYLLQTKNIPKKILIKFIKNSDMYQKNANGVSPMDLLNMNKAIKNYKKMVNLGDKKYNHDKIEIYNNSIMPDVEYTEYGLFNADLIHSMIYIIYLLKKFNNLTFPFQYPVHEKYLFEKQLIKGEISITTDVVTKMAYTVIGMMYSLLFSACTGIIIWKDKNLYHINKTIKWYIKRIINSNYKFIVLKLTIVVNASYTHANILLYDIVKKRLTRFEPYGVNEVDFYDYESLDKVLLRSFMDVDKDIKYISPKDYLTNTRFQTLSDEDNKNNYRLGDPTGYCLAWCIWFIEIKLSNPDVDDIILMKNAMNSILAHKNNKTNSFMRYIRQYAKKLDSEKNKIFEEIGIERDQFYETYYNENTLNIFFRYFNKVAVDSINSLKS